MRKIMLFLGLFVLMINYVFAIDYNLDTYINDLTANLNTSQTYRDPTLAEINTLNAGLLALDNGDANISLFNSLGFTVIQGRDMASNKQFIMLVNEYHTQRSWGIYIFENPQNIGTIIYVNHPRADIKVENIGLDLWRNIDNSALFISGIYRDVNYGGPTLADSAKDTSSVFHRIASYYSAKHTQAISIHGFADSLAPDVDMVISQSVGVVRDIHHTLYNNATDLNFRAKARWLGWTTLTGATNIQGMQYASDNSSFTHYEISNTVRTTASLRADLEASIINSYNPVPPADTTPPIINLVTSNATTSGTLKIGDHILFTIDMLVPEQELSISPTIYNGGALVWVTTNGGGTYTATYTVAEGQSDLTAPLQLTGITATDVAGNISNKMASYDIMKKIDAHKPVISAVSPESNTTINSQTVSYFLSESVSSAKIIFTNNSGSRSTSSTCTLRGSALSVGSHNNLSLTTGKNSCIKWKPITYGNNYTITFSATDASGNTASTVTKTNINYTSAINSGLIGLVTINVKPQPTNFNWILVSIIVILIIVILAGRFIFNKNGQK